ncbi:hypothetical protein [Solidesulfovibrio carbinolicus]|uniref:hypothetical protein n=1 Tax=Solidesulfovibrio carbinolicus TaxID=296842 RepID=UPI0010120EBE|nr:hypothetical protein [Solidesulfovibrio carbinolicus]
MAETINISKMAEIVSKEIFTYLNWEVSGPTNENTPCIDESHACKTHPADVVFRYVEPYEDKITHVLCDLKSYSKETIKEAKIKKAIEDLNIALSCARRNTAWQEKYIFTEKNINIKGMLFIYNHDSEYDKDFMELFKKATDKISIDKGNKISVIGPKKILYLSNLASNIQLLRGKKQLPDEEYGFFYPEQPVRKIFHDQSRLPLTIEQIGGSFHILRYSEKYGSNTIISLDVYLEDKQNEFENFQHLFDYLRKNNCLQSFSKIRVFAPFSKDSTRTNYEKALRIYGEKVDENFANKIKPVISYEHINKVIPQFFSEEIGMRDE